MSIEDNKSCLSLDVFLYALFSFLSFNSFPPNLWRGIDFLKKVMPPLKLFFVRGERINVVIDPLKALFYAVITFFFILYLIIDLLKNQNILRENIVFKMKLFLILFTVFIVVIIPTVCKIYIFPKFYAHDGGVLQVEEAVKFLLNGKNPYSQNYKDTILKFYSWGRYNPALWFYVYLPGSFLISCPFYVIFNSLFGWYDQRVLYLLVFFLGFFILYRFTPKFTSRLNIFILWGLNPFLVKWLQKGSIDVLVLFFVIGSLYFLKIKRFLWAGVFLGIALGIRQNVWFILPFYLVFLGFQYKERKFSGDIFINLLKRTWSMWLVVIVLFLPFLVWDFKGFISSVILYPSGKTNPTYPIGGTPGIGFGNVVLFLQKVKSIYSYFPFWIFQIMSILLVVPLLINIQLRKNTLDILILNFAVISLVIFFFSRYFHINHLGSIIFFLGLSLFIEE